MPYIAIKGYPKDEETKKRVAERILDVFLEEWGCPKEAVSISIEAIAPEKWEETVEKPEVLAHPEKMMILAGEKQYK